MKDDALGGTCITDVRDENAHNILVGKPEGKRPVGRRMLRWENIRIYVR
jgi:hypothetical protein